jgi:collagen type VI alpha
VALLTFSSAPVIQFDLDASFDKQTIKNAILAAPFQNAGTATGRALNMARTDLLTSAAGFRGIRTVVIVVTDGNTQEPAFTLASAAASMQAVAEVFAVGAGADIDVSELNVIASDPKASHVFQTTFDGLATAQITSALAGNVACNDVTTTTVVTTTLCSSFDPLDLIFVLDSSGSLGEANWLIVQEFAASVVKVLPIGADSIRYDSIRMFILSSLHC